MPNISSVHYTKGTFLPYQTAYICLVFSNFLSNQVTAMFNGKETEAEKRKQPDNDGIISGRQKQKKARDDKGDVTAVKEDEVEEFFAILGRIRRVVRHFKNADGGGSLKVAGGGSRLRAMLERDEEANGVQLGTNMQDCGEEENLDLDLNADPDPECDPS
nr:uncharacterized protein LOC114820543 [Malus domestica]